MSDKVTTLIEALKRGIWSDGKFIPPHSLSAKYLEGDFVIMYHNGNPATYYFKMCDYGVTWALHDYTKR